MRGRRESKRRRNAGTKNGERENKGRLREGENGREVEENREREVGKV